MHAVAPDAEDAVQDAALIALRRIGGIRDPDAAGPWPRMVVRNVCRARLRTISAVPVAEPALEADRRWCTWTPAGSGDSDPLPDGGCSMSRYGRITEALLGDIGAPIGLSLVACEASARWTTPPTIPLRHGLTARQRAAAPPPRRARQARGPGRRSPRRPRTGPTARRLKPIH
ncbi:RNA polymerase sigma factor [Actinacidiphila sp. bgisy167]|uniref:RNA polymerase sigma factor n=1 Tax=Actinacidiphila sp. bgisy167 TaxID=3413797 RepID=UPI003D740E7A